MTIGGRSKNIRLLVALSCAGALAACGGGDGGDGFDNGADLSGLWFGPVTPDGGGEEEIGVMIAEPNGDIHVDILGMALLIGEAETNDNSFSAEADGYSFQDDFPDGADFELAGEAVEDTSIEGAYSGAGQSGTFAFEYDPALSTQQASLPTLANTYETLFLLHDFGGVGTITIAANGDISGGGGDVCTVDGSVTVRDASRNLYSWTASLSGCPVNGTAQGIGIALGSIGFQFLGKIDGGAVSLIGFEEGVELSKQSETGGDADASVTQRLLEQSSKLKRQYAK